MLVRHSRGGALVETTIFLPLFLLALFGVMWAVRAGVTDERVQLAVRYSGLVSQEISPYEQYSLWSVYTGVSGSPLAQPTCAPPPAGITNDTAPEQAQQSAAFWAPDTVDSATCVAQRTGVAGGGLSAPALFTTAHTAMTASNAPPSYLQGTLGAMNSYSAQQTFVNAPDVAAVMHCYPALAQAIGPVFQGPADNATPAQPSQPLADPPAAASASLDASCLTAPLATGGNGGSGGGGNGSGGVSGGGLSTGPGGQGKGNGKGG